MDELASQLTAIFVPAITTVVGIMVAWGLAELRKYIAAKSKNEAAIRSFDTVADLVNSSVKSLNQTARKVFDDGKLTAGEKASLKGQARNMVIRQLPEATKKILDQNLNSLEEYVGHQIEKTVAEDVHMRKVANRDYF